MAVLALWARCSASGRSPLAIILLPASAADLWRALRAAAGSSTLRRRVGNLTAGTIAQLWLPVTGLTVMEEDQTVSGRENTGGAAQCSAT
jgi:hypothetical protein